MMPLREHILSASKDIWHIMVAKSASKRVCTLEEKVIFPDVNFTARTDEDFEEQVDPDHHHGISSLLALNVGLVTTFPLDYMPLVCLERLQKLLIQY